MSVAVAPRSTDTEHDRDLEQRVDELEALIEEARRRARRRRLWIGASAFLVAAVCAAGLIGFGGRGGAARGSAAFVRAPGAQSRIQTAGAIAGGEILVTMRGYVIAARTLHLVGGRVHYREAGRFRVEWRIPSAQLTASGRTFRSTSATVIGTTSVISDNTLAESCHGILTARRRPFLLRVLHGSYDAYLSSAPIGFIASPSPIATVASTSCAKGTFAARWQPTLHRSRKRTQEWWLYNHPGGSFYGKNLTPTPKGGASEGWITGRGPAGSFRWLAVFRVHRLAGGAQAPAHRHVPGKHA